MSKKSSVENPYHLVLKALNAKKVDYVVVGLSGINYYAKDGLYYLMTADYDIFIRSSQENVKRTLEALITMEYQCGFKSVTGEMKVIGKVTSSLCKKICDFKSVIVAEGPYKTMVEILQEVSGFTFEEMFKNAVLMEDTESKCKFRVGRLEDLLESKRRAGRQKDLLFLAKYKGMNKE